METKGHRAGPGADGVIPFVAYFPRSSAGGPVIDPTGKVVGVVRGDGRAFTGHAVMGYIRSHEQEGVIERPGRIELRKGDHNDIVVPPGAKKKLNQP